MPLYEYRCLSCGHEFEELKQVTGSDTTKCKKCGSESEKKMSRFAPVISGGGAAESVDMKIGREADKRWQLYSEKQGKRRGDKKIEIVDVPKTETGQYMPVMGLGSKAEREKKKEYSGALQEHRKERVSKGQTQFVGTGAF